MVLGSPYQKRTFEIFRLIIFGLLLVCSAWWLARIAADWRWEHHPVHALVEGLGSFAAITAACLILILHRFKAVPPSYTWVVAALAGMGILDGFHAALHAGPLFVWLHSTAEFVGGLLFLGILIPAHLPLASSAKVPLVTTLGCLLLGICSMVFPDSLPAMQRGGQFSGTAQLLNVTGGVSFLVAAIAFAWNVSLDNGNRRLFASHCLLFGVSGIIFEQSQLWDGAWWLWHGMRFLAYGCVFGLVMQRLYQMQVDLAGSHESMQSAVAERSEQLQEIIAESQRNEAMYRKLAEEYEGRSTEMERMQLATLNIAEDANDERERADNTSTELREVNAELDQFAYVASHDLKAPLRAIENLALWIHEDANDVLPDESKRHLETLQQRIIRMRALLDDLLAYSRAGRKRGTYGSFETREITHNVVELIGPPVNIDVVVSDSLPMIESFPVPFELVMRNLVSNAVKHMGRDEGKIEISSEEEKSYIAFSVSDDGPGIPADCRERVFEMFQTLNPRDEIEGTGMGLAIVRKVIDAEGGKIMVEDSESGGARFTFWWPRVSRRERAENES